jgi:endonuclease/exonuclease/phosphatase family metal-dependent hydrolase
MKAPHIQLLSVVAMGTVWCLIGGCQPNSEPTSPGSSATAGAESAAPGTASSKTLAVCSFNIQFLGSSARRDNAALAELLKPYDIVVVQELIAAPAEGPNDQPESRQRAAAFFKEMATRGFQYVLSESDTGRNGPLNNYSTATEWWVTFYKPASIAPVTDIPHGFISAPLAKNPDYDRVPYAFAFRTPDHHCDFVLISVHLNPDDAGRRAHELNAIGGWVAGEEAQQAEKDFVILGDMNIQNPGELQADTPANFISLNQACVPTNVNPSSPKPYDHVMFDPRFTTEIDRNYGFKVVNLIEAMRPYWHQAEPYPGDPFQQNTFRFYYSDHDPVVFHIQVPDADDD